MQSALIHLHYTFYDIRNLSNYIYEFQLFFNFILISYNQQGDLNF